MSIISDEPMIRRPDLQKLHDLMRHSGDSCHGEFP
jgi:hypothetical protein